jgi:hypothetical protein
MHRATTLWFRCTKQTVQTKKKGGPWSKFSFSSVIFFLMFHQPPSTSHHHITTHHITTHPLTTHPHLPSSILIVVKKVQRDNCLKAAGMGKGAACQGALLSLGFPVSIEDSPEFARLRAAVASETGEQRHYRKHVSVCCSCCCCCCCCCCCLLERLFELLVSFICIPTVTSRFYLFLSNQPNSIKRTNE